MMDRSEWNPEFASVNDLLLRRAVELPQQRAFAFLGPELEEAAVWNYQELHRQALAVATALQGRLRPGDRALLLYPPGMEFLAGFFGCLYAGVVAVPACPPRPSRPMPHLEAIVHDAQPSLVLTSQSFAEEAARRFAEVAALKALPHLATDALPSALSLTEPLRADLATLAFLQYTSGSTSLPKGIMVSHGNLLHNSQLIRDCFGYRPNVTSICWIPPYHDMGLIGALLGPIFGAFQGIIMSPMAFLQRPLSWLEAMSKYRAAGTAAPNFAFEMCAARATPEICQTLDLSAWEVAICGSEPVRVETLRRFADVFRTSGFRGDSFFPSYGLGEATLMVSGAAPRRLPRTCPVPQTVRPQPTANGQAHSHSNGQASSNGQAASVHEVVEKVSCGRPLPQQHVVIVDPLSRQPVATGEGEIWVAGPSVALGYWQKPEETRRSFQAQLADGSGAYLRTGDLGFLHDGELYVSGRIKELIIIRGRNHYPQDIELTVEQVHPALKAVSGAAFAIEVDGEERLALVHEVERAHRRDLNIQEVAAAVRKAVSQRHDLDPYALALLRPGSLPRTSSGKIQRSACRSGLLSRTLELVGLWSQGPIENCREPGGRRNSGGMVMDAKESEAMNRATNGSHQAAASEPEKPRYSAEQLQEWLVKRLAEQLALAPETIDCSAPFDCFAMDSKDAIGLSGELEDFLGCRLSPTLFYEYPTIASLTSYLATMPPTAKTLPAPVATATAAAVAATGGTSTAPTIAATQRPAQPGPSSPVSEPKYTKPAAIPLGKGFRLDPPHSTVSGPHADAASGPPSRAPAFAGAPSRAAVQENSQHEPAAIAPLPGSGRNGVEAHDPQGEEHVPPPPPPEFQPRQTTIPDPVTAANEPTAVSLPGTSASALTADTTCSTLPATVVATIPGENRATAAEPPAATAAAGANTPSAALSAPSAPSLELTAEICREIDRLETLLRGEQQRHHDAAPAVAADEQLRDALARLRAISAPSEKPQGVAEPIAVIGLSCRFPGAASPDEFWTLLENGGNAVSEAPKSRWDVDQYYDPDPRKPGKMSTRWGGFLADVDKFDAAFFGISPREANTVDPQQRLFLEVAWEALENAGHAPDRLAGTQTGVFLGMCTSDYAQVIRKNGDDTRIDGYCGTGSAFSVASGRLSYVLGLHGPNLTVDTACSSSLVAVQLAVQSLRNGESDMALAGGVNMLLAPEGMIYFSKVMAMSADGRCKTFDASANGYVRGEGCGVVVLKRLSAAVADGDQILAVIRGAAVNHDGRSNGLTAPNGQAQERVIRQALQNGGIQPEQVSYVECHGTGTPLGDPIEAKALGAAYQPGHDVHHPLIVGSVKTNIGHLEGAAGVAGLIKVILALRHQRIPRNLHFTQFNPLIAAENLPLRVPTETLSWDSARRIAAVSSFGFGGTNAHIVLEEAPAAATAPAVTVDRPWHAVCLSAKTPAALEALTARFDEYLAATTDALPDICHTVNVGRAQLPQRAVIVADTKERLRAALADLRAGKAHPQVVAGRAPLRQPKLAMLFTGQGSQYPDMGRELFETQPVFRAAVLKCCAIAAPHLNRSLLDVMYPSSGAPSPLNETQYAQPALFALEYATFCLWQSWGVVPSAVLGHSLGEYVAACVAGLFTLEDSLRLVCRRASLMQSLPSGARMAAVLADVNRVQAALGPWADRVSIAAVNAPDNVVIAGEGQAIDTLLEEFAFAGVPTQPLAVSHAFHSPLLEPILDEFETLFDDVAFGELRIPLIANLTGAAVSRDELATPSYWRKHARQTVQFAAGVQTLHAQGIHLFLEVGPTPTLSGLARRCVTNQEARWLPSFRKGRNAWQQILESLGALSLAGFDVNWREVDRGFRRRLVHAPNYPFQRERYWIDPTPGAAAAPIQPAPAVATVVPAHSQPQPAPETPTPPAPATVAPLSLPEAGCEITFSLSPGQHDFVRDHRLYACHLLPGAGFVTLALEAAQQVFSTPVALERVRFSRPMLFPEDSPRSLRVAFRPEKQRMVFQEVAFDGPAPAADTIPNAHGQIIAAASLTMQQGETLDPQAWQQACPHRVTKEQWYQGLASREIELLGVFRWIESAWCSPQQALGRLVKPAELTGPQESAVCHPSLLDACFQLVGLTMPAHGSSIDQAFVPVAIESVQLTRGAAPAYWAYARIRDPETADRGYIVGDITLVDDQGTVAGRIVGLRLQSVTRTGLVGSAQPQIDAWLHEMAWRKHPRGTAAPRGAAGDWLLLAADRDLAEAMLHTPTAAGRRIVQVVWGAEFQSLGNDCWQVRPDAAEDFRRLLQEAFTQPGRTCQEIIQLTGGVAADSSASVWEAQRTSLQPVLHLVQAAAREPRLGRPSLTIVTRDTQSVTGEELLNGFSHSSLWGLGRTLAGEHPELRCLRIDLEAAADPSTAERSLAAQAALVCEELAHNDGEDQVAFRHGERYVARLVRCGESSAAANKRPLPQGDAYRLQITQRGVLDNIVFNAVEIPAPGPGQVGIEIVATGLNFRDVLNVMGLYPGDAGPLGGECAGRITAVGAGVTHLRVGDEVLAIAPASFGSHTVTHAQLAARKPANMSWEQAAGFAIAFLTAHYGLTRIANMQRGERVLIHAASGGVGLAAVQLAQRAGAEIFATAGSDAKRDYLRSLGVQHVFDSRSTTFAEEIRQRTNGQGVDIVLNALIGPAIAASLSILAPGGRFVEMGKTELLDPAQIAAQIPGARYTPIALDHLSAEQPALVGEMLQELLGQFARGELRPSPQRTFLLEDVVAAFRFMAQARHIGKIVVTHPSLARSNAASESTSSGNAAQSPAALAGDRTYLVTGGLGALGLVVARWAVRRGARHLVLTGRGGPNAQAQQDIQELERQGVRVVVSATDVSDLAAVQRLLHGLAPQGLPPLAGVFHAAGVLDDGVLMQQTWPRFEKVLAPKVAGAWNLHQATRDLPLDHFVLFSSMAAMLGSPGQGNYAAANAFLDGLAAHRRQAGLAGTSIAWGPWTVGMAAGHAQHNDRWKALGLTAISIPAGQEALDRVIRGALPTHVGVLPIDWERWAKTIPTGPSRLLQELVTASSTTPETAKSSGAIRCEVLALPEAQRVDHLRAYLHATVAHALDLPAEQLDVDQPLNTLGFDSLMAVEVKNRLETDLGIQFTMTAFLEGPTIRELAPVVLRLLDEQPAAGAATSTASAEEIVERDAQQLLENLDSLSEAEVDALLAKLTQE